MYQTENWKDVRRLWSVGTPRRLGVSSTVLFLGLTSLFTDVSSEMVSTILPMYLVLSLQLSPLQFGVVDGLYQGVAAFVRVCGGFAADRWHRHREVAGAGYGLSAICKLGLLAVGGAWIAIAAVIVADRIGKGIRTAPRDAMISLSTPRSELATAFGVHRALDTAGAMIGPLVAFGLLAAVPGGFDVIFVTSFCVALVGLGVLVLFVRSPRPEGVAESPPYSFRAVVGLLVAPRFRMLVIAGAGLSLATISDGFVYLTLQRRLDLNTGLFPLLYVATALVYLVLAVPVGRLADRVGRVPVFLGGYAVLLGVYATLLLPAAGVPMLIGCLVLLGVSAAATDGVLMAVTSSMLPDHLRASGLAMVTTATSLARLLASVLFGVLWTVGGVELAVTMFLTGLFVAIGLSWIGLGRAEAAAIDEPTTA
jgi:MFS family permease